MNSSQNFSDLVPNLPHPEIPGIMLSTLLTFFHLIFKHFYTIDIVDAKRAVQDYTHLEVTAPGSEPKLSKSKILVREKHIYWDLHQLYKPNSLIFYQLSCHMIL